MNLKEAGVLGVLMYLFKHYMKDKDELVSDGLLPKLEEVGFQKKSIIKALTWLSNLAREREYLPDLPRHTSIRIYNEYECERINFEARGYIALLEQNQILNPITRELVIAQVIELEKEGIDISLIKWVTLLVLFIYGKENQALAYMEFLILSEGELKGNH